MPSRISVLVFHCPNTRNKYGSAGVCNGFIASYPIDSSKGKYLAYCSKCGQFYIAESSEDVYHLKKIDKSQINFISAPYILDGEV
jgi:hypothetical protein